MNLLTAIYIALAADPRIVLRPNNPDPPAQWVILIAKVKLYLLPWYW